MQVSRIVLLYLALVLCLTAWIPVGSADKEDAVEDAVPDQEEPDAEVETEPDAPEEKVRILDSHT